MKNQSSGNFPNELITEKHLQFYHKYGFMMIKGLHTQQMVKEAEEATQNIINIEVKEAHEQGREANFSTEFQGKQKFKDQRLVNYFDFQKNHKMCADIIGEFEFKQFQFAPRFFNFKKQPYVPKENQIKTTEPYDLKNLPKEMSEWSKQFLMKASELGIYFAPSSRIGWHIDGMQKRNTAHFSMLWGSYISNIPKGDMGNLLILPGTHHTIANQLKKGHNQFFDKILDKKHDQTIPIIKKEGIADGEPYSLLAEPGDIMIAHPWLAHGIGVNYTPHTRLAMYARLVSKNYLHEQRPKMAGNAELKPKNGQVLEPEKWEGDYEANFQYINEWMKQNPECLRKYDEGRLEQALKSL